jgi:hypothetical protein
MGTAGWLNEYAVVPLSLLLPEMYFSIGHFIALGPGQFLFCR